MTSKTEPLHVLVSYPLVAELASPSTFAHLGREVVLETTPYEIDRETQSLREQQPFSTAARDAGPELTAEQRDAFARAEVLLTLDAPLDIGNAAPNLRWIQAVGSGVGQYAASGLDEAGVTLTNAAGVGAPPIAEWVIGRILESYKKFVEHEELHRNREWLMTTGRLLKGATVGIVGMGAIGRETAVRLRAFGVHLLGVRGSFVPGETSPYVDELFGSDSLAEVLERSDVVVVAARARPETDNMFDAKAFATMRPGAMFINVSRGTLVDEDALIAALGSGHLGCAAIDVAREEPLPRTSPLWSAPNLRISPHSSTSPDGYMNRVLELFVRNLELYISGEPLENRVGVTAR